MFRRYYFLCFCLFSSVMFGQAVRMVEYDLNKNLSGAVYKFSFVHITDVHIGEDAASSDYGTPGYFNDSVPVQDSSKPVLRLQQAVKWINYHEVDKNIKFVVLSGDLTGSAEKSEFQMCKNILDSLHMPYVPVIGNHDIWPYIRYQNEAPSACGDSVMGEVFSANYDKNKLFFDNWNDGTRLLRTYNPETQREHYLQNFSFEYDGFIFYALDFNPRYHVNKEEPGIGPEAQLMDWSGGTFQWLQTELLNNPNKGNHNVLFVSHHPATDNILVQLSNFVFDATEYDKIIQKLSPFKSNLSLWLAGHIHVDYAYPLVNNVMQVRGMAANKDFDSARFEIINVYEAQNVSSVQVSANEKLQVYPNPNNGIFTASQELFSIKSVIKLYDVIGNLIYEKPITYFASGNELYTFDFSALSKGSYSLVLSDEERTYSQRLIIR